MAELAAFDISQEIPNNSLTSGTVGVVISNDATFLARFNRKESISGHNLYYFTIIYSANPNYKINSEAYIVDTKFKNFLPVSGSVKIINQGGNLFMITEKQSYPLI